MTIYTQCRCGQAFQAQPSLAGQQVACPTCGQMLVVPQLQTTAAPPAAVPMSGGGAQPAEPAASSPLYGSDLPGGRYSLHNAAQEDTGTGLQRAIVGGLILMAVGVVAGAIFLVTGALQPFTKRRSTAGKPPAQKRAQRNVDRMRQAVRQRRGRTATTSPQPKASPSSSTNSTSWRTVAGDEFSFAFPGHPRYLRRTLSSGRRQSWKLVGRDTARYEAGYHQCTRTGLPEGSEREQLDTFAKQLADELDADLESQRSTWVAAGGRKVDGVQFRVFYALQGVALEGHGRVYRVGRRFYYMVCAAAAEKPITAADQSRFFKSFALRPAPVSVRLKFEESEAQAVDAIAQTKPPQPSGGGGSATPPLPKTTLPKKTLPKTSGRVAAASPAVGSSSKSATPPKSGGTAPADPDEQLRQRIYKDLTAQIDNAEALRDRQGETLNRILSRVGRSSAVRKSIERQIDALEKRTTDSIERSVTNAARRHRLSPEQIQTLLREGEAKGWEAGVSIFRKK